MQVKREKANLEKTNTEKATTESVAGLTRTTDLAKFLGQKLIGQPNAVERIIPFVRTYQAGLAPEGRPIAVFLLLGPTGTGKTRTVELLAEALHGSAQRYLRIDCGEFQLDHEVAKLIGSPPGYLGHRETVPVLSKQKLAESVTPECDISVVLFDEIEKAAPSLGSLLLGVLDKGRLTLGDNSVVNFEKSLLFFTSNLGAREMMREINPSFGFEAVADPGVRKDFTTKLESVALTAVRKRFSPEFVNRIDAVITYQPLSAEAIEAILEQQIHDLQNHVNSRLGPRGFSIDVTSSARNFLVGKGVSVEYGARELKRTVYRQLTQPLATLVAEDRIAPGSSVTVTADPNDEKLHFEVHAIVAAATGGGQPTILIVDDNEDLLKLLTTVMQHENWEILTATSAERALRIAGQRNINVALVDYMLPDQDGLALGRQLKARKPKLQLLLMTGGDLYAGEKSADLGAPVIQKPFLMDDLLALIRSRLLPSGVRASGTTAT